MASNYAVSPVLVGTFSSRGAAELRRSSLGRAGPTSATSGVLAWPDFDRCGSRPWHPPPARRWAVSGLASGATRLAPAAPRTPSPCKWRMDDQPNLLPCAGVLVWRSCPAPGVAIRGILASAHRLPPGWNSTGGGPGCLALSQQPDSMPGVRPQCLGPAGRASYLPTGASRRSRASLQPCSRP